MLSFRSRLLNIMVIIYIVYTVCDNFKMPDSKVPPIHNTLSETEIKIKKIKQEMEDRSSKGKNQDTSFTTILHQKIENMLNDLFGDHLKILKQIEANKK